MTYYRVANASENLFETASVEIAEELNNISKEEIFEMYGVDNEDDLNNLLEDHLFFTEGHFGAGIYYNGVCCCESLESLRSYFTLGSEGLEDSVIFVFEGDWIGSCNDGEVVDPTQLIETLSVSILDGDKNVQNSGAPKGR